MDTSKNESAVTPEQLELFELLEQKVKEFSDQARKAQTERDIDRFNRQQKELGRHGFDIQEGSNDG